MFTGVLLYEGIILGPMETFEKVFNSVSYPISEFSET